MPFQQRRLPPVLSLLLASCGQQALAQMQFEIPQEMLQGMMGGMMGGGQQQRQETQWPKSENSEVAPEFEWIVNTEWKGKTAKYLFSRDGIIESPLKECEQEGMCKWAANNGRVLINTPTLKVIRFTVEGLKIVDRKKLENKDQKELDKLKLVSEKAGKSGKRSQLDFSRVDVAVESDIVAADLYKLLEVPEDVAQSQIKSKFRRLSVQNHPDKGGDPKVFNDMREANEILGDPDKRRYYDLGGMQLVRNIELAWKEVEGQKAQMDAQLSQVPKNHPQYHQFKAQIEAQKQQFEKSRMKHEIEKKMRSDDSDLAVPVSVQDLYNGVASMEFKYHRLVICRGCRANPESEECKDCGRCPPEKVQVPQYANTPFGKQVVGMKDKEQESRERCRQVPGVVKDLRIPKGAKDGATLKYVSDIGDQTPGKLPGKVVLKVQRGSPTDTYTISESDLYTVLHISMEQAIFGFEMTFSHLGTESITISRGRVEGFDEVLRVKKRGLPAGGQRGDLYIRLAIDLPKVGSATSLTLNKPTNNKVEPKMEKEVPIELREGSAWKQWLSREAAINVKSKKGGKDEL